ncbi:MAG: chloride channel protein [Clostridia bacterium]|nr:chloride channel protein [Clostridia bacterium]
MEDRKESHSPRAIAACIALGCIVGGIVGVVIFFFKLIGEHLEEISHEIYHWAEGNLLGSVLVFAGLVVLALIMYLMHRIAPEIKGGGIPRSTGIMRGLLKFSRVRTFFGTLFGSWISFFSGLTLGSEGPSVLIGTSLGAVLEPKTKKGIWGRYITTAGAGAGFSVATGAPITAILFILEEVHKRLTARLVLITSASALVACFVNQALCSLFGLNPTLFAVDALAAVELTQIHYILILAVIVAVFVWIFDVCVVGFKGLMKKAGKRIPDVMKLIVVFLLVGIVGLIYPSALYGGRGLILGVMDGETALTLILLLLVWRLGMMILTSNSGATGGTFVPTLCIGGLIGGFSAELMIAIGMPDELYGVFVLIAMCAFLGGTMRAPLTAVVFFVEATSQSNNLLYAAVAVFVVYFITNALGHHSFNDVVLEEMIEAQEK